MVPRPFTGERLSLPEEFPVQGHPSMRLELYLARGAERPAIQVSCAGTLVADDAGELHALDLAEPPWVGCELAGLVEFPGFTVPPGSRRGVAPDAAAESFAIAMKALRPLVEGELRRLEQERRAAANRQVVEDLRRALRGLRSRLPQYDLPPVLGGRGEADGMEGERGAPEASGADILPGHGAARALPRRPAGGGPHRARPGRGGAGPRAPGAGRGARRRGAPHSPRRRLPVVGGGSRLLGARGGRPPRRVRRGRRPSPGVRARLRVEAEQEGRRAAAEAAVEAVEPKVDEAGLGIPEPNLVDAPGQTWRSRFDGTRWEVNSMHEDYLALKGEARARLRYLLTLLAKDLSQHAHRVPVAVEASEDVAAILALAERNLRGA